jgi:hypothetical protein
MPDVDGFSCFTYSCSGDDDWAQAERLEKGLGAAGPLGAGLRDDVNCGARIKDVMLSSCVGPAECAAEAAGACEATTGCASFAISSALNNYTFAMLFSAAREGLRPNAQWNTWVRKNETTRVRAPPSSRVATRQRQRQRQDSLAPLSAADGSTFPVSFSTSLLGPWTTVLANTTSPTNGNNPAPFLASNGSVFVVFNDGGMSMFRSDTGFRGPYSLVTRNTCGGGEDRECRACLPPSLAIRSRARSRLPFILPRRPPAPAAVIWLGTRGWHCLNHRGRVQACARSQHACA